MLCTRYKIISRTNGKKNILASIVAGEKPGEFPTTGEGIENLDSNFVFVPGSRMMVLSETTEYILGPDDGKWYKWRNVSGSSGGGGDEGDYDWATDEEIDDFIDSLFP